LQFKDGTTKHIVYHTSNGMHQEVTKKTQKDSSNLKVDTKKIASEEEILIAEEVAEDSLLNDNNLSIETTDNEEIVEVDPIEETEIEETLDDEITNQNQHYPFFMEVKEQKVSSTGMPLVPWYSIAVDKRYVPLGSCLLAATPIVDKKEKFKYHALQFVLAQDTGEAIRGTGRVDWYVGAGDKAAKIAQNIHHYGQLWLILPKKKKTDGLTKLNNSSTIKHSR
jgi:3D (Asp-Asp-Asp) domain-containing protein